MPEPVAAALLIAVAIAYLVGAVLLVAALAKVLLTWLTSQRTGRAAAPVDDALQQRAETAMAVVAQLANVAAPATDVVAVLGSPAGGPERGATDRNQGRRPLDLPRIPVRRSAPHPLRLDLRRRRAGLHAAGVAGAPCRGRPDRGPRPARWIERRNLLRVGVHHEPPIDVGRRLRNARAPLAAIRHRNAARRPLRQRRVS